MSLEKPGDFNAENIEKPIEDTREYVVDENGEKVFGLTPEQIEKWNPEWRSILTKYLVEQSHERSIEEGFEMADEEEINLSEDLLNADLPLAVDTNSRARHISYSEYPYKPAQEARENAFNEAGINDLSEDMKIEFKRHNIILPRTSGQLNLKIINLALVGMDEEKYKRSIDIPESTLFLGEIVFGGTDRNNTPYDSYVSLGDEDKEFVKDFLK